MLAFRNEFRSFTQKADSNVSQTWLSPLWGRGSLTMTFTGKYIYIYIYKERDREIDIDRSIDRQIDRLYMLFKEKYIYILFEK